MADSDNADFPDVPPPEVPEEFAAAYREAYRRALEESGVTPEPPQEPDPESSPEPSPELRPGPAKPVVAAPGAHRVTEYRSGTRLQHLRESAWFLPVVAVLLVLALVLAGWLLARTVRGDDEPARTPAEASASTDVTTSESPTPSKSGKPKPARPAPHRGPVAPVKITAISATCTLEPGTDSAGQRVAYVASNAIDGDAATAWRCAGDAVGQRLVLRLPEGTRVAGVGLVPGYAKTDPTSGVDRYAQNNRITEVRWRLTPGVNLRQRLDPDPRKRGMQVLPVPLTAADRVVLEILAVARGGRAATAISELVVAAPR